MERKTRPNRFTEVLGEDVDMAFKMLASEILKDGALTLKDKSIIGLACAVAVKCDDCVKAHKKQALKAGANEKEILEAAAVAGLVRMGSGFNTAYALLDDHSSRRKIEYKTKSQNEKNDNHKSEGKQMPKKPDGYLNAIYGKKEEK